MTGRRTTAGLIAALFLAAVTVGGCGLGPGPGPQDATLTVTHDFGGEAVGSVSQRHVPAAETVMQLLKRSFTVATTDRGRSVESIDGRADSSSHRDWSYYVNGIEPPKGPAKTLVHKGDHIWWDFHDWTATDSVPAVVGAYPEPFTNGIGGQRLPTVLDCASDVTVACQTVAHALTRVGVKVAYQLLGGGSGSDSLAVVVGTYQDLRGVIAAELIKAGPAESGVYAQFVGSAGQVLELDNPKGEVVDTLRGSVGLIAATEQASLNEPAWLITGTDQRGVDQAAAALTEAKLRDHFALAISGKHDLALPLSPGQ